MSRGAVPAWAHGAVFLGAALAFALLALALGQDANWDLRNYHWYNPYALLGGRYDSDVAVAQGPSFFNPLLDVPVFLAGSHLSARATSVLIAAVQSLNLSLIYLLCWRSFAIADPWRRLAAALAVAVAGAGGAVVLSETGTTMQDTLLSVVLLAALLLIQGRAAVLQGGPAAAWAGPVALAGLLAGLAMGAKTTMAVLSLGLCLAFLAVPGLPLAGRFRRAVLFGVAALAGMAASGGWWFWHLWRRTGNPLFPFFNDVFRSPLLLADSYKDRKFLPADLAEALFYPLLPATDPLRISEVAFFDLRLPLLALVLLAGAGLWLVRRRLPAVGEGALWPAPLRVYVVAFAVVAYILWLQMFAIHRYVITLELLAPAIVAAVVAAWPLARSLRLGLVAALLAAMVVTVRPADWGRVPWSAAFVPVALSPAVADLARQDPPPMLLMGGVEPMGYVVPAFPAAIPVVRIQSYLYNPWNGVGFVDEVRRRLDAHLGGFLVLYEAHDHEIVRVLAAYGLALDDSNCGSVNSPLGPLLKLCPARRVGPASSS